MIGNLYLHRLLEKRNKSEKVNARLLAEVDRDGNPERFFGWAFERFLLSQEDDTKAVCLQVMTIVYQSHHTKLPVFRAMRDVVHMIDFTFSKKVRDNLLMFIEALLYEPLNAKSFMNANGVELVTELMTLVHWDTSLKIAAAGLENNVMMLEDSREVEKEPATYWFYKIPAGFDGSGQVGRSDLGHQLLLPPANVPPVCVLVDAGGRPAVYDVAGEAVAVSLHQR